MVVGTNVGIGLEAAKHFARMGPQRLICTCRSEAKCAMTVQAIIQATGYGGVECWPLELSEFASVRSFVERIEGEGVQVDILINNAGMATEEYVVTQDGFESTIQVNHLAGTLLAFLLLPNLLRAAQKKNTISRIVTVTSNYHRSTKLGDNRIPRDAKVLETLSSREFCTPIAMERRYADSKLLNTLFAPAFAAHIPRSAPIVVNAVCPGFCHSQILRTIDRGQFDNFKKIARTSEEGSRQLIFAALGPDPKYPDSSEHVDVLKGAYIQHNAVSSPSDWVKSEEGQQVQSRLWDETWDILCHVDDRVTRVLDLVQGYD